MNCQTAQQIINFSLLSAKQRQILLKSNSIYLKIWPKIWFGVWEMATLRNVVFTLQSTRKLFEGAIKNWKQLFPFFDFAKKTYWGNECTVFVRLSL